jgi:hypothetical protein
MEVPLETLITSTARSTLSISFFYNFLTPLFDTLHFPFCFNFPFQNNRNEKYESFCLIKFLSKKLIACLPESLVFYISFTGTFIFTFDKFRFC